MNKETLRLFGKHIARGATIGFVVALSYTAFQSWGYGKERADELKDYSWKKSFVAKYDNDGVANETYGYIHKDGDGKEIFVEQMPYGGSAKRPLPMGWFLLGVGTVGGAGFGALTASAKRQKQR